LELTSLPQRRDFPIGGEPVTFTRDELKPTYGNAARG
jgi:hypothetical protein